MSKQASPVIATFRDRLRNCVRLMHAMPAWLRTPETYRWYVQQNIEREAHEPTDPDSPAMLVKLRETKNVDEALALLAAYCEAKPIQ